MLDIHLDAVGGVAGDMFVAALLDLRPALGAKLLATLAPCLPAGVSCRIAAHNDGLLAGKRFLVDLADGAAPSRDHTAWRDIRAWLGAAALAEDVKEHAVAVFSLLAEAEGKVHGRDPEQVAFHEAGAWDSVADIVAAAILIAEIGARRWTIGALPLGSGRIRTAHGLLPVPAPATVCLLDGFETIDDGIAGERVTPTGAAIVRYLCAPGASSRAVRKIVGAGYGFGTRKLPGLSNCLRALAFEESADAAATDEQVAVIECEIDDQSAEDLALAVERLRAAADVLDVIQAPVFGKKGRMMTHLRILARPDALAQVIALAFEETATLGLRHSIVARTTLSRAHAETQIEGKTVRLKIAQRPDGATVKAEADDLAGWPGRRRRERIRRRAENDAATEKGENE